MKIISINAGSSSLKFQMFEMPEETVLVSGLFERIGMDGSFYTLKFNGEKLKKETELKNHADAVQILMTELIDNKIISSLDEINGVGHRVVHGGSKYASSVVITEEVEKEIENLIPLAPLHNPANLTGIQAFNEKLNVPAVAVFDTAFHQTMPKESFIYGVPYEWYENHGVRRYGFHGISHDYVSKKLMEELNNPKANLITCHLGNGGSISAIKDGICYNTSMGFSPNAGLIMGTRSGDVDATFIPYVMEKENKSLDEIMNILTKKSGFLGISQKSSDARDIEDGIAAGDEKCILANDLYVNRVVDYVAKYYVQLGRVDGLCFTAGLGENSSLVREMVLNKLSCLGIELDTERNNVRGEFRKITTENSKVPCYIVPTDEELMIARDTYSFIK